MHKLEKFSFQASVTFVIYLANHLSTKITTNQHNTNDDDDDANQRNKAGRPQDIFVETRDNFKRSTQR